jgi:hypothetical protein
MQFFITMSLCPQLMKFLLGSPLGRKFTIKILGMVVC